MVPVPPLPRLGSDIRPVHVARGKKHKALRLATPEGNFLEVDFSKFNPELLPRRSSVFGGGETPVPGWQIQLSLMTETICLTLPLCAIGAWLKLALFRRSLLSCAYFGFRATARLGRALRSRRSAPERRRPSRPICRHAERLRLSA